jgi:hypothetical protein
MHLWFEQAKMPGKITRLLTAHGADHLTTMIPTHISLPPSVPNDAGYSPYNKPAAVDHWLREVDYIIAQCWLFKYLLKFDQMYCTNHIKHICKTLLFLQESGM